MKMKCRIMGMLICLSLYMGAFNMCSYGENTDVYITTDMAPMQYSKNFDGTVTVHFENMKWYNENVKLSYHIYGSDGSQILFENERIPIASYMDGDEAKMPVAISLGDKPKMKGVKKAYIKFDLIDEKNLYWFGESPAIKLKSDQIAYDDSKWMRFISQSRMVAQKQGVVLALNLCAFMAVIICLARFQQSRRIGREKRGSEKDGN